MAGQVIYTGDGAGTVAGAGDVNADGWPDLLIGNPHENDYSGVARIHLGSAAGVDDVGSRALVGVPGPYKYGGAYTGQTGAPAGDVNGDGYADVIVGSPGDWENDPYFGTRIAQAYLVEGSAGATIAVDPLRPGIPFVVDVDGLTPGAKVQVYSGRVAGTSYVYAAGLDIDIDSAKLLGKGVADASGHAFVNGRTPAGAKPGHTLIFQAVAGKGSGFSASEKSEPIVMVVQP